MSLGVKSRWVNDDVEQTWKQIRDIVPERDAYLAVEKAVTELTWTVALYGGVDAVAWGWSAGKDSLALQVLTEIVGIRHGVCVWCGELEFRMMTDWAMANLPAGVEVEMANLTLPWLKEKGLPYLFAVKPGSSRFWQQQGTRLGQKSYIKRVKPRLMVYGRRTADNNVCGDAGTGLMDGVLGVPNYNPMRNWSHEMTLAVISYYWLRGKRRMPPIYKTADGWTSGTGVWPGRHYSSIEAGWKGTHDIDPFVVNDAAEFGIPGAAEFLERIR